MRRWILELEEFGFGTIENCYSNNLRLLKIPLNLSRFKKLPFMAQTYVCKPKYVKFETIDPITLNFIVRRLWFYQSSNELREFWSKWIIWTSLIICDFFEHLKWMLYLIKKLICCTKDFKIRYLFLEIHFINNVYQRFKN